MKWKVIIGVAVLFLCIPHVVHAQEPETYNDAFLQYNLKTEDYNKAHETYVLRRSQYLKFKSLQSEKDAHDATVAMLQVRDDVVVAYIKTLKKRMEETPGVSTEAKNILNIQLDVEITFFNDHKAKIPSTGTLSDLVADSNLAKDEFTKAQPLFYQTLFAISKGKVADLRSRLGDNFIALKSKVEAIRAETRPEYQFSTDKTQAIDRFIFESDNKLARADEKKLTAEDVKNTRVFNLDEYNQRVRVLGEAQQLLKDASSFLKEIVNEIKKK